MRSRSRWPAVRGAGNLCCVTEVAALANSYRDLAHASGSDTGEDPTYTDSINMQLQAVGKSLSMTAEGRNIVASFMSDPDPWVRLFAAAQSLRWSERRARTVLQALRDDGDESLAGPGKLSDRVHLCHLANTAIRQYDAGRLTFDL